MQNRKKAKPNLLEYYDENKEDYVIVIIPTVNAYSEWAMADRVIFKGLHIIFAE